jgi:hypothetical protein
MIANPEDQDHQRLGQTGSARVGALVVALCHATEHWGPA